MTGRSCTNCGARFVSPRLVCPECQQETQALTQRIFPTLGDSPAADASAPVAITVIVPSYNSAGTIRPTLQSILAQDFDEPYEVIVVDSSSDETPAIISQEFPQVRMIHRPGRTEPGTARNLAIAGASGELIACVDSDCAVNVDWLSRMVAGLRAGHDIIGGSVQNGNAGSVVAWAGFFGEFREFIKVGEPRPVRHLPTCNIAYRREVFSQAGGFPTSFYPQEDLLFHWRLNQQGFSIWFDPDIQVKHTHRSNFSAYLRHQYRIGHAAARVLELTGREGAFLARSPLLATLSLPALPLIKFLRTVAHFRKQAPGLIRGHWQALPILLVGLYAWGAGFVAGAWDDPLRLVLQEPLGAISSGDA